MHLLPDGRPVQQSRRSTSPAGPWITTHSRAGLSGAASRPTTDPRLPATVAFTPTRRAAGQSCGDRGEIPATQREPRSQAHRSRAPNRKVYSFDRNIWFLPRITSSYARERLGSARSAAVAAWKRTVQAVALVRGRAAVRKLPAAREWPAEASRALPARRAYRGRRDLSPGGAAGSRRWPTRHSRPRPPGKTARKPRWRC